MADNVSQLKIVGNNCRVLVNNNQGEIEVIGNNCRIEVSENYGSINLVGANGVVTVNRRNKDDRVQMLGHRNNLIVDGRTTRNSYEAQLSPFSKNLDSVIEDLFTFVMR